MSLLWRNLFTLKDGCDTVGTFRLMLKNTTTKLARLCGCCPCPTGWYIVGLCPCPNCTQRTVQNFNVDMEDHAPGESRNTGDGESIGNANSWACGKYPAGYILGAVTHTSNPAPFDGTIEAEVFINGASVETWGPESCSINDEVEVGDLIPDSSPAQNGIVIDNEFVDAGSYNVDLVVTFKASASGVADVVYTCRKTLEIIVSADWFGATPWIGSVAVLPDFTDVETYPCLLDGIYPATSITVGLQLKIMKGPFDSEKDATDVLTEFDTIIHAYAEQCLCEFTCDTGFFGIDYVIGSNPTDWHEIEEYGKTSDNAPGPWSCEDGWVGWTGWVIAIENGAPIEVRVDLVDSLGAVVESYDESDIPSSGALHPCGVGYRVYVRSDGTQPMTEEDFQSNIRTWLTISGENFKLDSLNQNISCSYNDTEETACEDRWGYIPRCQSGPCGVPNTTADLNDHRDVCLIECQQAKLLSELPEALV